MNECHTKHYVSLTRNAVIAVQCSPLSDTAIQASWLGRSQDAKLTAFMLESQSELTSTCCPGSGLSRLLQLLGAVEPWWPDSAHASAHATRSTTTMTFCS
jgi:hypothetical protein